MFIRPTIPIRPRPLNSNVVDLRCLFPDLYALDVDLDLPDGALVNSRSGVDPQGTEYMAALRHARDLDINRNGLVRWWVKERSLDRGIVTSRHSGPTVPRSGLRVARTSDP